MKKITIFLLLSVLFFTACQDVLNKEPLDIISDATVWSDPVLIDDYLNQCYAEMNFLFETQYNSPVRVFNGISQYGWFEMTFAITFADEARSGWTPAPKSHWININGGVMEWWGYPTIRKLNTFLEKLEPMEVPAAYKTKRLAEARFLRAFSYFNLVKRYGGVPLITRAQQLNDPDEELYRERNKEAAIYDFILSELDAIVPDLPATVSAADAGRPSKYAALALKSRAAMYAGSIASFGTVSLDGIVGIPQNKASQYWQASYDASNSIITSKVFALYNKQVDKAKNFRNLFLDEGNSEVIFSERFDGLSGKGHSWDMWMVPKAYHIWNAGQQGTLYLEMVESFDNIDGTPGVIDRDKIASGHLWTVDELWGKKDPRFKASVYTQGASWKNGQTTLDYHVSIETPQGVTSVGSYKGVLAKTPGSAAATPFGVLKYLDEAERSQVMERNYSDTDYIIFRLGEIYLNYAEAAMELGKNDDAKFAVNELHKRAGMPEYPAVSRDLVRKERKVELAFEGNRYWDLRRWRTAKNDLTKAFHGLRFILDGNSFAQGQYNVLTAKYKVVIQDNIDGIPAPYFDDKHYYLPIGLGRTANNSKLVENPGYQ
ncbi:MAG: RagB/SusD family nutrient uptake outer membrane protein [Bacteroidota bacterium]|nr:RagB/SusD family nutrient uptake outer membrane protein [Bacteroidota bacterium]